MHTLRTNRGSHKMKKRGSDKTYVVEKVNKRDTLKSKQNPHIFSMGYVLFDSIDTRGRD